MASGPNMNPPGFTERERAALTQQTEGDYYSSMAIQPVEYILANSIPFIEGCVIKYVSRWRNKRGIQDLEKARHFLDILIEHEQLVESREPNPEVFTERRIGKRRVKYDSIVAEMSRRRVNVDRRKKS